jgi:hypothetical protein
MNPSISQLSHTRLRKANALLRKDREPHSRINLPLAHSSSSSSIGVFAAVITHQLSPLSLCLSVVYPK